MIDLNGTKSELRRHLHELTVVIGERSAYAPDSLKQAEDYIASVYEAIGLPVEKESYTYHDLIVSNVVSRLHLGAGSDYPVCRYLLGAHYDSVEGTVGADDNASAVAVQLEVARHLMGLQRQGRSCISVKFVSFALEEAPVFMTRFQGSVVHARGMRARGEQLDGMLCLEMVGYACRESGCQGYPFPVNWMGYPKTGDFIGVVGNMPSRTLTRSIVKAFRRNPDLPVASLNVPLNGWPLPAVRLSDHASFWDRGYPAVMITDSAFFRNPHYHLPSDTMDKLDYDFMAELVESLVLFFSSSSGG
jgi:hypothetical protein